MLKSLTTKSVTFLLFSQLAGVMGLRIQHSEVSTSSTNKKNSDIMLVAQVNLDYIDSGLFDNWFYYAKPFLNHSMLLIFDCDDEKAKKYLSSFAFGGVRHTFVDDLHKLSFARDPTPWGSAEYGRVVSRRPRVLKAILERGHPVFYFDLDTVWNKNPFDIFNRVGTHDLLTIADTEDPTPATRRLEMCTCILYFQPSQGAIGFLTRWIAEMGPNGVKQNQPAANRAIGNLDLLVLERTDFPPGSDKEKGRFKDPTVYHANWRSGTDSKIEFFKDLGLWSVNQTDVGNASQ